ncbi:hypothetical protein RRG08_008769 [Elysia crispata]|uniref:Uncharacterized protein n=1 Tax=Elysia crispata TaxID=231223 RepID=A0AAE1D2Q9_9GAST|nr:hypothetical protein RRG08_008769 [Elysia crispata]
MPFGLKSAAQTFQRLMDSVLQEIDSAFVYLDDILIASPTEKEHMDDLKAVFRRLIDHGLVIRLEKCLFGVSSLEFLGHQISKKGSSPTQAKVKVIQTFPQPSTVKGLQEFLGMINFYHRFLPNIAATLSPLYGALKSSKPRQELVWSQEMKQAFLNGKTALANAAMLVHPCTDCPLALTSDASDVAVGAVLEQFNKVSLGIDYIAMARAQAASIDVQAYKTAFTCLEITNTRLNEQGPELVCDVSRGRPRPIIPPDFRRTVFDVVHNLSHPGVKATVKMVSEKFVWHGMRKQVSRWVKECHHCQSSKIQNHTKAPLEHFSVPEKRFSHINIDIVGPLPFSSGFTYLLTIIDRNTRWPEAIPLRGITTPECVHALITGWIARFGVPGDISSDRGSQFTSSLWTEIAARLGVKLHHTSAYHPQANGMIERFHRTLKTALKARLTGPNWVEELPWVLLGLRTTPKEDLGYSSAELVYGEPLTIPGELVPPKSAKSMDDLLLNFRLNIPLYAPLPASHHTSARTYLSPSLLAAKHVYVRRDGTKGPLQRPYSGPYAVLTPGEKTFLIDIGGRTERISVDRIKPAFFDPFQPVILAKPPPRGRPPAKQSHPSRSHPSASSTASKHQQAMSRPAVQTSSRTGRTIRPPMRYQ